MNFIEESWIEMQISYMGSNGYSRINREYRQFLTEKMANLANVNGGEMHQFAVGSKITHFLNRLQKKFTKLSNRLWKINRQFRRLLMNKNREFRQ